MEKYILQYSETKDHLVQREDWIENGKSYITMEYQFDQLISLTFMTNDYKSSKFQLRNSYLKIGLLYQFKNKLLPSFYLSRNFNFHKSTAIDIDFIYPENETFFSIIYRSPFLVEYSLKFYQLNGFTFFSESNLSFMLKMRKNKISGDLFLPKGENYISRLTPIQAKWNEQVFNAFIPRTRFKIDFEIFAFYPTVFYSFKKNDYFNPILKNNFFAGEGQIRKNTFGVKIPWFDMASTVKIGVENAFNKDKDFKFEINKKSIIGDYFSPVTVFFNYKSIEFIMEQYYMRNNIEYQLSYQLNKITLQEETFFIPVEFLRFVFVRSSEILSFSIHTLTLSMIKNRFHSVWRLLGIVNPNPSITIEEHVIFLVHQIKYRTVPTTIHKLFLFFYEAERSFKLKKITIKASLSTFVPLGIKKHNPISPSTGPEDRSKSSPSPTKKLKVTPPLSLKITTLYFF